MDALGFYQPVNGTLDVVEFLATNLEGVCGVLSPQRVPRVVITEEDIPGMRAHAAPILYSVDAIGVFDPLTGDDDKRVAEFEQNPKPTIILVTCWPIDSTSHRIAVQAELE